MDKKWKDLTLDALDLVEIQESFQEEYSEHLKEDEYFTAKANYQKDIFYLTIILQNRNKSFYYPIEIKIYHNENKNTNIKKVKDVSIDFASSYFSEYLSTQRDTFIPIEWAPYKFMDINLQARGQVINKQLEEEAEKLLAKAKLKE